jgi:hypothetical protein
MKGRIFLLLFALPFFGVGVWMAWSTSSSIYSAWQMKQWLSVTATLTRAGVETHSGDDSDSYEAYAVYTYQVGATIYSGDRVSIGSGSDNIGDFQQNLGGRLRNAMSRGEYITVYVNPEDPADAVIDRSLRWEMVGFNLIFVFAFGGVGLGLIIYSFRAQKKTDLSQSDRREQPWLANSDWQTASITSSSKQTMYFTWGFAAFWNLVSAPLPFVVFREVTRNENYIALVGLLFPLVGAGLLAWAVRRTMEWRRFGPAPILLDPFPGSIGGHVGGTIDVKLSYDSNARFSLTLTSLYSYVSGSGKDRSRKTSAKWQDTQIAHATAGPRGTRLTFCFNVPDNLNESDAGKIGDQYYLWQLNVRAELPGADIDRDYEIPVYATQQQSQHLSSFSIDNARSSQKQIDLEIIKKMVRVDSGVSGRSILYPVGRNLRNGLSGGLCGAIFTAAGWYLLTDAGHLFMGAIFGGIGLLVLVFSLYFALNSLQVVAVGSEIRSVRRVLGIPLKRSRMRRSGVVRIDKKKSSTTQSGTRHIVRYTLFAVDGQGRKMVVGEGFKGASQARVAVEYMARELGLNLPESSPGPSLDEANLLAAE